VKTLTDLLPLGIGIGLIGALTWFLLDRDIGAGKWLLAFLLFAHGWVHVMFLFPQPEAATAAAGGMAWPFDMGKSWLASAGMDAGSLRAVGTAAIAVTLVAFLLSALATVNVIVPAGWWTALVVGSALSSTVVLALFFSPALLLGFAINLALLYLVLASVWSPLAAGG
jgi:hypothetical protein